MHVAVAFSGAEDACTELCTVLMDAGARLDARNDSGWTPLHVAAENLHVWAVRLLVSAHCDVDAADEDGETALHIVAAKGDEPDAVAAMQVLLSAAPDVNRRKCDGCVRLSF